jgi:hypothetical protein
VRARGLDDGLSGAVEGDAGQAVDAQGLDHPAHLRLCTAQQHGSAAGTQPASEQRKVDHQRHVGEAEVGEIDGDVGLGPQRSGDRTSPKALSGAVLVPGATEDRW